MARGSANVRRGVARANAKAATLVDPLTGASINASIWGGLYGTLSESVAGLLITNPISYTGYGGMDSVAQYDLTASQFWVRLVDAGNQALASWEVVPVRAYLDASNILAWYLNGGTLRSQARVGGVNSFPNSLAYNSAVHKYLRIREAGGTIFWDWSTDGLTWTNLSTLARPFAITGVKGGLNAGTYNPEASATAVTVDSFGMLAPPYLSATAGAIGAATAAVTLPMALTASAQALASVSAAVSLPVAVAANAQAVGTATVQLIAPGPVLAGSPAQCVGQPGPVATGAAGAAVTPTWDPAATRMPSNLLVCWCSSFGSATLPAAPAGWLIAKQWAVATNSVSMFYRAAAGGDAAPTIAGIAGAVHNVQLAEFSGVQAVVDQTTTPAVTAYGEIGGPPAFQTALATPAELGIGLCLAIADAPASGPCSMSYNDYAATWPVNVTAGSNGAVNQTGHFCHTYAITQGNIGSSNSARVQASMPGTYSVGGF